MREIKFRAIFNVAEGTKVVSTNSFTIQELSGYEEHEWEFSDGSSLPANDVEEGDLEYIQYTGLKDKNGKEIYEDDILKGEKKQIFPVEYGQGCFYWQGSASNMINEDFVEIIGNIYETKNYYRR